MNEQSLKKNVYNRIVLPLGSLINTQTEETQETALTLACCGGFLEVADFLIKAGADIELGASTPLMEAAQEGHLDLVRYLLESGADVHAQTQTGDTALTYACENGHTDVADLLLQFGADMVLFLFPLFLFQIWKNQFFPLHSVRKYFFIIGYNFSEFKYQ